MPKTNPAKAPKTNLVLNAEVRREIAAELRAGGRQDLAKQFDDTDASFKSAVPGNLGDNTKPADAGEQARTVEELKQGGILPPGEKAGNYPVLTAQHKRQIIATLLNAGENELVNTVAGWPVHGTQES